MAMGREEAIAALKARAAEAVVAPEGVKCNARTFVFDDGSRVTFHPHCDGVELDLLTEAFGRSLRPDAVLGEVRDEVHFVPENG